ncbi:GAF domain-containing protein [Sulfobacillus harzensis]|uniref:GAF domain-containing protein n=1 Tax=Sulfobacillus harzensis TaxID=2729629 RepID=A0A7Y0L134_9FIRM|nr:GAF domain-containing protein [Sulfobacillus harzensis]NMP21295.1 GAF domain-containing protein [Sulfobacillus harzensis]
MELELKEAARPEDVLAFTDAVLGGESNLNANLANIAALLNQYLPRINWVGFYLSEKASGDWVLGPFAGKPACTRIAREHGVVGTAMARAETLVVDNVLEFPAHIACDADSRSELVIPIISQGQPVGCLDVDSPDFARFGAEDVHLLEAVVAKLAKAWSNFHWY